LLNFLIELIIFNLNKTNQSNMDSRVQNYINKLLPDRKEVIEKLRLTINDNLPHGFEETIDYGMLAYLVPKSTYLAGYYCNPELSLPFLSIASQKNFIALYHMGIYANSDLLNWFVAEYPKHCKSKLDMGKSCIRFKKINQIPYSLIAELATKISPQDWINTYETLYKK
jgi:uncharacterized protein YdhG (YjbR/CyaY superfamily)